MDQASVPPLPEMLTHPVLRSGATSEAGPGPAPNVTTSAEAGPASVSATLLTETLPVPPEGNVVSKTVTVSTGATSGGWLHTNMRNLILLGVTGVVCYLALIGIAEARSGLIVTFTGLVSYLFAERASLKHPGKDT